MRDTLKIVLVISFFAFAVVFSTSAPAKAGTSFSFANGNPGDWADTSGNALTVNTSNTGGPSSSGYTGIVVPSGDLNQDNGPYTFFGTSAGNTAAASSVSQSIAVYLDPNQSASGGFWLDETPGATVNNSPYNSPQLWGAEENFRLAWTGSNITVDESGGATFATITQAGWYDFQVTWTPGSTGTDPVIASLSVTDLATSASLGSTSGSVSQNGAGTLWQSQYLAQGPGYEWFTEWSAGFAGLANNTLEVADVDCSSVPEPSCLLLLSLGLLGLVALRPWKTKNYF